MMFDSHSIISGSNKVIHRELKFRTCKQVAKDRGVFLTWKSLAVREMHINPKDADYEQEISNIKNCFAQAIANMDIRTYKKGIRKDRVPVHKTEEDLRDFVCEKLPNYFVYKKQLYRSFGTHWDECEMAYLSEDVHSVICRVKSELERGYAPDHTMEKVINQALHHFRDFVSMILSKITERTNPLMGDQNDFKLFIKDYNFNFETGTNEATNPLDYNNYSLPIDLSKAVPDTEFWNYMDSLFAVKKFNREKGVWEVTDTGRSKAESLLRDIARAFLKIEDKKGFFVFHGPSNTGKTTFVNLLVKALGPLIYPSMPLSFFNGKHTKDDRNVLSEIVGRRFAVCSEVPVMEKLDPYAIKTLSSNDYITVEKKFKDPETVAPSLTLIFTTNDTSLKDGPFGPEDIQNRCRSYGFYNKFKENYRTQKKIESEGFAAALVRNIERLGVDELNKVMDTSVKFYPTDTDKTPTSTILSSIFDSFKNPYDIKFRDFLKQFNLDHYPINNRDLEKLLEGNGYSIIPGRGRYRYVRKRGEEELSELPQDEHEKKPAQGETEHQSEQKTLNHLLMEDLLEDQNQDPFDNDPFDADEDWDGEEGPEEEGDDDLKVTAADLKDDGSDIPAWVTVDNRPRIIKFKNFELKDPDHNFTIITPEESEQQPDLKKALKHGPTKHKKGGKRRK